MVTEPGMELLVQLNILTGVQFTSPTGVIGNFNHGMYAQIWTVCPNMKQFQLSTIHNFLNNNVHEYQYTAVLY